MLASRLLLVPIWFVRYKFANSLFLGLSVGSIFTIYTALNPSIYSIGGIMLALAMLFVARLYHYILNALWFFRISLLAEFVLLLVMLYFLLYSYSYQSALLVYVGYQITFVFGSYLVRAETLLLGTDELLTKVDSAKQLGYLVGMSLSYLFYQLLAFYGVSGNQEKVYLLHFLLVLLEIVIIILVFKSFITTDLEKNGII